MPVPYTRVRLMEWLAAAFLLSAAPARADAVRLDVSEIVLKNTSKLTFIATPSATAVDNSQLKQALIVQTEHRRYEVRIPTADIPWWDTRQSFVYTFVVDDMQTRERHVFDVLATPAGSFEEQYTPVPFTIVGQESDKGVVPLPVASLRPERATVTFSDPKQRTLAFWGKQVLSVHVQNTSDLFPVTVQLNHADSVEAGSAFFDGPAEIIKPVQPKVTLRPQQTVTLDVVVKPKWSSALAQLILPRTDAEQANVTIKFDHQVGPFGGERGTWFSQPVDVRFQPTVLDLAGALFFGVLLGLAFRYLNGLATPDRAAWHAGLVRKIVIVLEVIGVALIGALALEVAALLMSSAGSRLVLFGFDIDPNALLPTLAIGAISGFLGKKLGEVASKAATTVPLFGKKAPAGH